MSTEQTKTIQQFIEENALSVEWTRTFHNPNMPDMPERSAHFKVAITCGEQTLSCYYSCGPGIVDTWAR